MGWIKTKNHLTLGWSRKWIFNYRISRNYPRKCSQLRVFTKALNVLKSSKLRCRDMRNFVITMLQ